ncbi:MAG TPA: DUF2459 domain-containing protein [Rhodopila sp.]|jgi:uncharacterized protein (TIGR02117 family)|nr:DUF2459 domain-containing protein [Rhodopila sp.]
MPRRRLAALCLALLTAACTTPAPVEPPGAAIIYVIDRGWHTDVALPVEEIAGPLASLEAEFPGVRVLTFGFGERQFLVTRQKNLGAMLNALLPSRSALLMTALNTSPQAAFGASNVVTLHVSQAGLDRIEASIWREFERSAAGNPVLLANGPYPGSVFYAAHDTYDGFNTCNTWTADTLRTGGVSVPVAGVLFSGQVMGPVRWIEAHQATSPRN